MARSDESGSRSNGRRDPVERAVHELGNHLHSLSLRLFVLKGSELGATARSHAEEAHRLADQSAALLAEIRRLHDEASPPVRGRLTRTRTPR